MPPCPDTFFWYVFIIAASLLFVKIHTAGINFYVAFLCFAVKVISKISLVALAKSQNAVLYIVRGKVQQKPFVKRDIE